MKGSIAHESLIIGNEKLSVEARAADNTTVFGFWMFLMTDFVLFASLFAVYAVLRGNAFGGPTGANIFNAPYILTETILLLSSSFTCGLAMLSAHKGGKWHVVTMLGVTALLGALFVSMELSEFGRLIAHGAGWTTSGFFSSYFTLVGTHGLHVAFGIIWMIILATSIVIRGLTRANLRKLMLMSLFWHFLDIVWIFIFTIVYMMGIN
jgi:cytochrome o ubiquinol oxidase subunit 3